MSRVFPTPAEILAGQEERRQRDRGALSRRVYDTVTALSYRPGATNVSIALAVHERDFGPDVCNELRKRGWDARISQSTDILYVRLPVKS